MPRKKSKKLKQLEDKLKIIKKEIARRKKLSASSSAPSKSKRSRKSAKSPFEECKTLLDKIKKIQYSKPFLDPVDWKALNIPTYPHIIKHPMDLHTIESKLTNNQYHNPYQFSNDMRLVYQNATTFNKPSTQYYMSATKFGKKFEEEFERKVVDQHETNSFTRKIHKVVSSLIRRDDSIPFRAPVNPQVLEIPDYLDVIDTPMDLGTILNKISYYTQFKHFVHDLFLVWDNCCRYNPKQNQIHQTALKLREYTQKQLNRLCPSEFQAWQEDDNASPPAYAPSSLQMQEDHETKAEATSASMTAYSGAQTTLAPGPAAHLPSDSDPNMNVTMDRNDTVDTEMSGAYNDANDHEMQNMNEEADTASDDIFKICDEMSDEEEGNKMMISYLVKKKELNPDRCGSLDFHQKEELQRGIQCLDSDHFDPLINMLQSFIPEGEGEDDEVELDVDSIDDGLQVKMYNYMLEAIRHQEDKRMILKITREADADRMALAAANNVMDIDFDSDSASNDQPNAWLEVLESKEEHMPQWIQCVDCQKWRIVLVSTSTIASWKPSKDWKCRMNDTPYNKCTLQEQSRMFLRRTYSKMQLSALEIQRHQFIKSKAQPDATNSNNNNAHTMAMLKHKLEEMDRKLQMQNKEIMRLRKQNKTHEQMNRKLSLYQGKSAEFHTLNLEQLNSLESELQNGMNRIKKARDRLLENTLLCSICLANSKNVVMQPCGHLDVCNQCEPKLPSKTCPRCQQPFTHCVVIKH
eukprot:462398_1